MRLILGIILALAASPALAQQPPASPPGFQDAAIAALQAQRNAAMDNAAGLQAQLSLAQKELEALKKADADAKAKSEAEPPKPEVPK